MEIIFSFQSLSRRVNIVLTINADDMSTCTKFGILIGTFTFLLSRCIINAQWISFPP